MPFGWSCASPSLHLPLFLPHLPYHFLKMQCCTSNCTTILPGTKYLGTWCGKCLEEQHLPWAGTNALKTFNTSLTLLLTKQCPAAFSHLHCATFPTDLLIDGCTQASGLNPEHGRRGGASLISSDAGPSLQPCSAAAQPASFPASPARIRARNPARTVKCIYGTSPCISVFFPPIKYN